MHHTTLTRLSEGNRIARCRFEARQALVIKDGLFRLAANGVVFLHGFSTEMMAELIRDGLVNSPPIQRLACRAGPLEPAPRLPTSPFWRVFLQTGHGHGDRTAWLRRVSNGFAGLAAAGSSLDRQKIAAIRAIATIDQRSRAAYPQRRSSNANMSTPHHRLRCCEHQSHGMSKWPDQILTWLCRAASSSAT
jgi:hypothetical protein